jgi:hypothetical protein
MFLKVKEALMNCMKRILLIPAFTIVLFLGNSSLHCSEQNSLGSRLDDSNVEIFCDHLLKCFLAANAIEDNSVDGGTSRESEGNIAEYRGRIPDRTVPVNSKKKKSILEKFLSCCSAN